MRADIKMLCVTNWGAVLELVTHPYRYGRGENNHVKLFMRVVCIADPDAIDAGQTISLDEIKLVIRRKR